MAAYRHIDKDNAQIDRRVMSNRRFGLLLLVAACIASTAAIPWPPGVHDYDDDGLQNFRSEDSSHDKRAAFHGMRGKKNLSDEDMTEEDDEDEAAAFANEEDAIRGKRGPSPFMGMRGKKATTDNSDGSKRAFVGMRGKKSMEEEESLSPILRWHHLLENQNHDEEVPSPYFYPRQVQQRHPLFANFGGGRHQYGLLIPKERRAGFVGMRGR